MVRKIFFLLRNRVYSDIFELSDEIIRIQYFHSVGSYDEKTAENFQNCYVSKHSFQTSKDIDPYYKDMSIYFIFSEK